MADSILPPEVASLLGKRSWQVRKEKFLAKASEWGKKGAAKRWGKKPTPQAS